MKEFNNKEQSNKKIVEVSTTPVPFSTGKNNEKIAINFNTASNKTSKEKTMNQAFNLHSQGNISEAVKYYKNCINQGFNDHRVFSNYGMILKDNGKLKEAEKMIKKAIKLDPYNANNYKNLGNILIQLGQLEQAKIETEKAIKIDPSFEKAYLNLGVIHKYNRELKQAERSYRKAIELNPDFADAYSNLGSVLKELGSLEEAERSYRNAIELNPDFAMAYSNLGNVLKELGNLEEAERSYRKAIELNPDFAMAYSNLGSIFMDLDQYFDAINFYKKAIKLDSNLSSAKLGLINSKGNICDWSNQGIKTNFLNQLGIEGASINPLGLFYYEDKPLKHLERAKKYFKERYYKKSKIIQPLNNTKIRIGYFTSDFRAHPTMYLIASLLKLHDKSKFEIYLYSFAPKEDKYTEIAKKSGCIFKDIKELNDIETVELGRSDKLDIAIDLMGYIKYNRISIFSYRVAPIQINYLGYPGSLGAETIDYIIADNIIIPQGYEKFYSEKIIRMPNCYQCNDNKKEICTKTVSRRDFNLPEKGFIFTCFNANKKITSKEFEIWMRILREVKGSVLWLYKSNKYSLEYLNNEAKKRNIDPDRLIFANSLPLEKHLARHTLGDLALDTFNYNGHTTTSDALWAGLPVLTKIGESFAARVSASILTSIGLTDLITYNEKEYEEKAINIAKNPEELKRIKNKLAISREISPLYNSELFTKNLESKFEELVR